MADISFITAFHKFKGPFDTIQRSALYSWQAHGIKTIAPLNEVGLKDAGTPFNVTFVEGVKRARELGFPNQSPIMPDLISKCLPLIDTQLVAFINSDIIITDSFSDSLSKIIAKYGYDIYLVGSRNNIILNYVVNSPETYKKVQQEKKVSYDHSTSSDILITSKFIMRRISKEMPDFILGRFCWDNWLHLFGQLNMPKRFNCSQAVPILHCEHGYGHIQRQEGTKPKEAPSSMYNQKLWHPFETKYGTPRIQHWPNIEL